MCVFRTTGLAERGWGVLAVVARPNRVVVVVVVYLAASAGCAALCLSAAVTACTTALMSYSLPRAPGQVPLTPPPPPSPPIRINRAAGPERLLVVSVGGAIAARRFISLFVRAPNCGPTPYTPPRPGRMHVSRRQHEWQAVEGLPAPCKPCIRGLPYKMNMAQKSNTSDFFFLLCVLEVDPYGNSLPKYF